jgi:hypothetical protein
VSGSRRFFTVEARILAVVALSILLAAILRSKLETRDEEGEIRATTFLDGSSGLRALYLAAEELGIPVGRWMRPFPESGQPSPSALAVVAPPDRLLASEARWLRVWVEAGGRLLYVPASDEDDRFLELLGLRPRNAEAGAARSSRETWRASRSRPSLARPDPLGAGGDPASPLTLSLLEGTPETVSGLSTGIGLSGLREGKADLLLRSDQGGAAAALIRLGEGRILLLSHGLALTNGQIRVSGAAPLVLRGLSDLSSGERLWFDEFHHGFDERGGVERATWRFLTSTAPGWAVLQLGCLAFAALFFAGLRMGSPLRPPPPRRRSSLEHVEALASAYQRARAVRRPAALLLEGLRMRLGARSADDLRERLESLSRAHPQAAPAVEDLLRVAGGKQEPGQADLVRLSSAMDEALSALGQGSARPGASAGARRGDIVERN